MSDLGAAKKRLSDTLRDRMQKYWDIMKDWYKRRISKDDFDTKAKFLLGENNVHLHNEFLFAVLVTCQTGTLSPTQSAAPSSPVVNSPRASPISPQQSAATAFTATALRPLTKSPPPLALDSPTQALKSPKPPTPLLKPPASLKSPTPLKPPPVLKPPKAKKPKVSGRVEIPYQALDMMSYYEAPTVQLPPRDLDTILLCSHELMLPDLPTMHTRMLLGAWEVGLDGVTEESAQLLMLALQYYLKNIIQALISSQTSYRTKQGTGFQHSFGHGLSSRPLLVPPPPPLSHSPLAGVEKLDLQGVREAKAIRMASLSGPVRELEPLNLFHLRDALRSNRHCVPVHSVYSFNMERLLAGMWHPSQEEEEQRRVVEQWERSLEKNTPFAIPSAANYGRR